MSESKDKPKVASILIIEDSFCVQKLIKQVVTFGKDYAVTLASDGRRGLEVVKESAPFNVILADIDMPVESGIDFVKGLRGLPDPVKASTPVLACTGNQDDLEESVFEEMGFNALFSKPIDYKKLIETIKPWVEHPRQ